MSEITFNNEKPMDFVAVGRLCIDLNANEINRPMEETSTFTKYVGGSPANICIGMARLGLNTGFIGKVADDQMGRFITEYLKDNGIATNGVSTDHTGAVTGLAFTEIRSPTDCSILMYRDNAADLLLETWEVSEELIASAKMILISGTALAASPSREAVFLALDYAKHHGAVIAFDLDYRPYTWKSPQETATYYNLAAEKCDIVLGTREEFDMMEQFGGNPERSDRVTAAKWFDYRAKIVIIKHGKEGSIAYTPGGASHTAPSFPAKVIKTFGAGDSYAAGFLYGLMQGWAIERCMEFGSAAASIVISSHSCSDAMPTRDAVLDYIQRCKRGEITANS
ncbi:MAG: 5-dehydro-2-deoxygluconokinase [Paenibacillus lautus]|jgi:5-dehydro-2-deoxygluconokinase|uniref:5-dehydro-2-deoxygluconokinase n=1 Tax=Paenibacillus lautus TaxID=1401 RepID=UPI0026F18258|nr:5-dehydro-2-deoxygluconokinase [Paenibacillus lautus]MCI1775470.1 5-dehydro-2-deoxygluconokinase [Paenibacillus lautus]